MVAAAAASWAVVAVTAHRAAVKVAHVVAGATQSLAAGAAPQMVTAAAASIVEVPRAEASGGRKRVHSRTHRSSQWGGWRPGSQESVQKAAGPWLSGCMVPSGV